MFDAGIIRSKGTVTQCIAILRPLMANGELGTTHILIGHVMLEERLLVVLQDLQALKTETS